MKNSTNNPLAEIQQHQLGLRIAARLSSSTDDLPHDVQERLRAAREQALGYRKRLVTVAAPQHAGHVTVLGHAGGAAVLGGFGSSNRLDDGGADWWTRIVSIAVAIALVAGLVAIDVEQDNQHTTEVAAVDAALLTDDLPPQAYADPGFVQFLKTSAAPVAPAR
ncbi:MAG: DUF3619 family protein [Burkholderiaceae bacterium]|jgi:hypothetical protein|nr:DUF3619 family protein [Burkholderiaceae bacterium]